MMQLLISTSSFEATKPASVLRSIAMQLCLVMPEVLQILVGLSTLLADVRLVVSVGQQVSLVACVVFESLAALPALKRPHP